MVAQEEDVVRDQREDRGFDRALTRRKAVTMGLALAAGGTLTTGPVRPASAVSLRQATPAPGDRAEAIVALARDVMAKNDLKAVIVRVTIDGQEVVTAALGESMTGVPATTDMHFRNGAVTYSYLATLVLRLVDQQVVGLDDALATWLPDLRDADRVTLRMLTNMTAGYPDYVQNPALSQELYADPFRQWTNQELIDARAGHAAGLRAGDQLGLLAHQLRHPGGGAGKDRRPTAGRPPAGRSPGADGLAQHRQFGNGGDPRTGAARLQLGAPAGARHPRRYALL